MATKTQHMPAAAATTTPEAPASSSCYKRKLEASTVFENVVDRFNVFVHASVDEHKACFRNAVQKVNEMPKAIKERFLHAKELSCNHCSLFRKS